MDTKKETLIVYTESGFAPFEYVSKGEIVGVDVDIMNKVGEKKSLDDAKEDIKTKLAEKKVSEDSTLSVTAMDKLREKYGMKIVDSEINEKYKKYINYQLNNKNN